MSKSGVPSPPRQCIIPGTMNSRIGMQHMADGATEYNEWTQRVMADVGDLVDWIAEGSGQSPEDVLHEVHGYARETVNSTLGTNVAPAPAKPATTRPPSCEPTQILDRFPNQEDGTEPSSPRSRAAIP